MNHLRYGGIVSYGSIPGYGQQPTALPTVEEMPPGWEPPLSNFDKREMGLTANDPVEHPKHYTRGTVELIELIGDLPFSVGNAIKYIYRAGYKDPDKEVEDLHKARFYLNRLISDAEIRRLEMEESHGG